MYQPSIIRTEKFHVMYNSGANTWRYGNMNMLDVVLYHNWYAMFRERYRRTSPRRDHSIEKEVHRMEQRSIVRKLMNSYSLCAENYRPPQKKKGDSGSVNKNNREIISQSKFQQILKHVRKGMHNYEDKIPTKLIERCGIVSIDSAGSHF